jgi:hypothetical protein
MRALSLFVLLVLFAPRSSAAALDFTLSAVDSGSIGGTAFSNSAFTIAGEFDPLNFKGFVLGFAMAPDNFTFISISGVGTFEFTTPISFTFSPYLVDLIQLDFVVQPFPGPIRDVLLQATGHGALADFDIRSPFGPVTVGGVILNWSRLPIETTGGVLVLDDVNTPITFQASVLADAPEPSPRFLIGFGLLGVVLSLLHPVIRRFLGDDHVVHVTLTQARG